MCLFLTWRILSITLLVCETSTIVQWFEHSLALPFFGIGMKTDLFQFCATAEFSKFAGIFNVALSQHHLLGWLVLVIHNNLIIITIRILNETPQFISTTQIPDFDVRLSPRYLYLANGNISSSCSKQNSWMSLINPLLLQTSSFQLITTPGPPVAWVKNFIESTLLLSSILLTQQINKYFAVLFSKYIQYSTILNYLFCFHPRLIHCSHQILNTAFNLAFLHIHLFHSSLSFTILY